MELGAHLTGMHPPIFVRELSGAERAVVEPARKLTAAELQQRLCASYRTPLFQPLAQQLA
jgi:hypothetical protein